MADPIPPRPGVAVIADQLASIRSQIRQLKSPSGTQRAGIAGNLSATVERIGARTSRVADPGSGWSMTVPGDGVQRYYETATAIRFDSTGSALVQVSTAHARITLLGVGSAAVSLRMAVRDPATGEALQGPLGGALARLASSSTCGTSLSFGALVAIRPGPVEIAVVVGVSCTVSTSFEVDAPGLTVRPL